VTEAPRPPGTSDDHERPGPSPFLYVYVAGTALVLVSAILPWLRGPRTLSAWDVSVFWSILGRLGLFRIPPSVGVIVLVAGLILAAPVVFRRPVPVRLATLVGVAIFAIAALTLWRGLTFPRAHGPHVGLVAAFVGSAMASVSSTR
jgi:hypothetical protein